LIKVDEEGGKNTVVESLLGTSWKQLGEIGHNCHKKFNGDWRKRFHFCYIKRHRQRGLTCQDGGKKKIKGLTQPKHSTEKKEKDLHHALEYGGLDGGT